MKYVEYFGSVDETGRISLPKTMREEISQMFAGYEIKVTVKIDRTLRSNQANAYYWRVVIPHVVAGFVSVGNEWMSPDSPEDKKTVHRFLKNKFLSHKKRSIVLPDGTTYEYQATTTDLDTREFAEYLNKIRAWTLEMFGIDIPESNKRFAS